MKANAYKATSLPSRNSQSRGLLPPHKGTTEASEHLSATGRQAEGEGSQRRLPGGGNTHLSLRGRVQVGSVQAGSMGKRKGGSRYRNRMGLPGGEQPRLAGKSLCCTLVGHT